MRHRKRGRKLSRTSAHRKSTRQNLAKALIEHERIVTTPAKAKETKSFVEKLITLARKAQAYKGADSINEKSKYLHYYRLALRKLQDKKSVQKLFGEGQWREGGSLAERYAERPSGQTRIIKIGGSRLGTPLGYAIEDITELNYNLAGKERKLKLIGNRLGDNAEQVIFELVRETEQSLEDEVEAPEIAPPVEEESPENADQESEKVNDTDAVPETEDNAQVDEDEGVKPEPGKERGDSGNEEPDESHVDRKEGE